MLAAVVTVRLEQMGARQIPVTLVMMAQWILYLRAKMMYINLSTNAYPVSDDAVRESAYPASLPEFLSQELLSEHGYAAVEAVQKPTISSLQLVKEGSPELIGGIWRQTWIVNTRPMDQCRAIGLSTINSKCEQLLSQIKTGYPQGEVESWSKQELEAKSFIADSNADVPLISAIASARGLPVAELASRILLKSSAYAAAAGAIVGTRQALEDALNVADEDTIHMIAWPE